jgi:hypothetical protein
MKPKPNNYFHVRVYTDDGSKIELFRDRKQVSTRQQIIAGLRRAIELLEKLDAPPQGAPREPPSVDASDPHAADPGNLATREP